MQGGCDKEYLVSRQSSFGQAGIMIINKDMQRFNKGLK